MERQILSDDSLAEVGACFAALLFTPGSAAPLGVVSVGDCVVIAGVVFEGGVQPQLLSGVPHNVNQPTELHAAMTSPPRFKARGGGAPNSQPALLVRDASPPGP